MGGGYSAPDSDGASAVVGQVLQQRKQLRDLQRPGGTRLGRLYDQVQETLANIVSQVNTIAAAYVAANTYTRAQIDSAIASPGDIVPGAVAASGPVSGASGTFAASLSSPGAYTTDVSGLPGGRQTVWQHNSGVYGFAPSTIEAKTNIGPVPFTAADVLAVAPHVFQYKAQVAIREDPNNEYFDPDYEVPWEIGLMAEDLIAHNMAMFVFFEADGITPKGVNYDLFGAIAPLVVLTDIQERLAA